MEQPRVGDASRERSHVIHRRRERDHPVGGHVAERGFQPDAAARRCGNPNRSAGVGADARQGHAGDDADGRAAARSAGRPRGVERMARRTERRFLVGRAEGEFVQVGLADQHGPGRSETGNHGGVSIGAVAFTHARGGGRRQAADVDQVLHRDRDPVQRSAIDAGRQLVVGAVGLRARLLGHDRDERIQPPVHQLDPLQAVLGDRAGGHFAPAKQPPELLNRDSIERAPPGGHAAIRRGRRPPRRDRRPRSDRPVRRHRRHRRPRAERGARARRHRAAA